MRDISLCGLSVLYIVVVSIYHVGSQENDTITVSTVPQDVNKTMENLVSSSVFATASTKTIPSIEDHPARIGWRKTEKAAKMMTSQIIKKILPLVLRSSENLNISSMCSRHILKFLSGVKQMKLWAFHMLDASGKIPNGVLTGTITSLGDYDECLAVNVSGQFQGSYCTVELLPPMPVRKPFYPVDLQVPEFVNFTSTDSVVGEFMSKAQHYHYLNFRSSLCFPSTCSRQDVEAIAKKVMDSSDLGWDIKIPNCESLESTRTSWSTRQIVVLFVMSFILFLAVTGTAIDVILTHITESESFKKTSGVLVNVLICFSFYSNTKKLLKKDDSPDSIKIFHGMKVITVLWVILNHTYYYVNLQVFGSLLTARRMGTDILFQFVLNGFLNVETFFFISSVLVVYGRIKASDKDFTCFLYIFRRLWRLTPPFMFVIAFAFLIPNMGSGPAWKETVGTLVDNCKNNWWTNLLYFNNFVTSSEMCMQWMWYIPVDTHLYFLSLLVLIPIKHRPRLGFFVIGAMFVAGTIATAISNIYYELHPTAIYAFPHPDDIEHFVNHGYFKTYLHAVTYCVGMIVGYILATRPKLKIPPVINIAGWVTSFVLAITVLYGVFDWNQGNTPSLAVSTLYTCTNKFVWALALGWVTVSCFTGNGGIASSILSWSAFVPFSRLTYMAYLIHPVVQHMYVGSTRTVFQTEHRTLAFLYLGHVVVAYILAYFFSQLFEVPFMALEKVMFSRARPKAKSQPAEKETTDINKFKSGKYINADETGVYAIKIRKTEDDLA